MESKINLITWYNKYYWYDKTDSTIENKLPNNTRILYTTFAYYHTTQRDTKLNTNESKKEKRGEEGTVIVKYSYKDNSPVYSSLHCRAAINVAILSGNYSTHRRNTRSNHPATLIRNSNMSSSLSLSPSPLRHRWTCISGNYANRGSSINRHYWRLNRSVDRCPRNQWFRLIFHSHRLNSRTTN